MDNNKQFLQRYFDDDASGLSVEGYLARIGYTGSLCPTMENLKVLQKAHVSAIPYEDLDIRAGKYISIALPDVYQKIVVKKRGGYCFELNGLFAWLLRKLGYDVVEYYGRYLEGEPLEMPMRRHRIARVMLDGKPYICDVGVGVKAPVWPIEIKADEVQILDGEEYRMLRHPALGWLVQGKYKGEWNRIYSFTEDQQFPVDFEMPNHWCVTHPDSIFKNVTMVYIRTPEGRNTMTEITDENGKTVPEFRRFTSQGVQATRTYTKEEYNKALLEHFGIVL
ncbi:MAG: arylamine N-acetyltransferase [Christensenella sp.]|nr:arylamine N-acetyltransferase [Christensenella sp.]